MSDYESSDSNHRLSRDLDDDFEEDEIENETGSSQESAENVDDRLKALIELMGSRGGGNGLRDGSGHQVEKEDTLKYLSQLETVARRLKDQLLSDRKKVIFKAEFYIAVHYRRPYVGCLNQDMLFKYAK